MAFRILTLFLSLPGLACAELLRPSTRKLVARSHDGGFLGGPEAYMAARKRWGAPVSEGFVDAVTTRKKRALKKRAISDANPAGLVDGRATLPSSSRLMDAFFTVDVGVGNPPQNLPVVLDTGSSDFWVYWTGTDFSALATQTKPKYFDAATFSAEVWNDSSGGTTVSRERTWNITYADGDNFSGIVITEPLTFGSYTRDTAHVQVANEATIRTPQLSGILGMAKNHPTTIKPPGLPSVLQMLVADESLEAKYLSIDLRAKSSAGSVSLGALESSAAGGDVVWMDDHPEHPHWTVRIVGLPLDNGTMSYAREEAYGVVDTGTTILLLPREVATAYWSRVPGASQSGTLDSAWMFPCEAADALPDFEVILEKDFRATIPGRYMDLGPVDAAAAEEEEEGEEGEDGEEGDPLSSCFGGLQSSEGMRAGFILGNVLNKAVFLAFDLEGRRVGFGLKELVDSPLAEI